MCVRVRAQRKGCICSEQHHIKYTQTLHAASAWIHSSPPALTVVWGREAGPLRREGRSLCGQTGQSHPEGWVLRQQKRKTHLFSLLRTRWNVMVWSPTSPRRGISERKEPTKVISWRGERTRRGGEKAALLPLGLRSRCLCPSVDELVPAVSAAASRSVRVSDVPSCGYTDAVFIFLCSTTEPGAKRQKVKFDFLCACVRASRCVCWVKRTRVLWEEGGGAGGPDQTAASWVGPSRDCRSLNCGKFFQPSSSSSSFSLCFSSSSSSPSSSARVVVPDEASAAAAVVKLYSKKSAFKSVLRHQKSRTFHLLDVGR